MTPEECRRAIRKEEVVVEGRRYLLTKGTQRKIHFYSHGGLDSDGTCQTADFVTEGVAYESAYEQTSITMAVNAIKGMVNVAEGTITFDNGLKAN